jgi:hypothetical protein
MNEQAHRGEALSTKDNVSQNSVPNVPVAAVVPALPAVGQVCSPMLPAYYFAMSLGFLYIVRAVYDIRAL